MQTSTPPSPPDQTRGNPRRSLTDRHLGGVSSAVATFLGVSVTTARVLLVVSVFVGGLGLVVYAASWLFVPDTSGNVLIRGQASSSREPLFAAVAAGIAAFPATIWVTRNGPDLLVATLVTIGVFVLARRGGTPAADSGGAAPPAPPVPPPYQPVSDQPVTDQPVSDEAATPDVAGPSGPADSTVEMGTPEMGTAVLPPIANDPAGFPRAVPSRRSATATMPQPSLSATPKAPKPPKPSAFLGPLTVSIAVAVAGSMTLLHTIGAIDIQLSDVLVTVLIIIGLGLLTSTWYGRARGLILIGLLLIPAVLASAVIDRIDFRGGVGDRRFVPQSATELSDEYRLGAGTFELDLTELDPAAGAAGGETLRTSVSMGAGAVQIVVPEEWSVTAAADVAVGEMEFYDNGGPMAVGEPEAPVVIDPDQVVVDLGTEHVFDPGREIPIDGADPDGIRRTLQLSGDEGAPAVEIDIDLRIGVVEVFRVNS